MYAPGCCRRGPHWDRLSSVATASACGACVHHRKNRNPRPQPQTFSKVFLTESS